MFKRSCVCFAMLLIISCLLFTVSCAEKTGAIKPEATVTQADENAEKMAAEKKAQLEEQKLIEEKRLQEEAKQRENIAARNIFLSEDIRFEFDKAVILPETREVLKKKAAWLQENPDVKVMIEGHCDDRGTTEYNIALGARRAESAKACMIDLGIAASRMSTISYGEERPVDPRHNEEAWAKNRRAHFAIRDV